MSWLEAADTLCCLSACSAGSHLLLVGPEGDFTDEELEVLREAGARPVGLGSNRLRTETAALALLATAVLSS